MKKKRKNCKKSTKQLLKERYEKCEGKYILIYI